MEIEFNAENIGKCLCIKCKVQKTQCVHDKLILLQERALSSSIIGPKEFPALHCVSGIENCSDLNENEECLCGDCPIYMENDLESGSPERYFCLDGQSTHCYLGGKNIEDPGQVAVMLRHYYRRTD